MDKCSNWRTHGSSHHRRPHLPSARSLHCRQRRIIRRCGTLCSRCAVVFTAQDIVSKSVAHLHLDEVIPALPFMLCDTVISCTCAVFMNDVSWAWVECGAKSA